MLGGITSLDLRCKRSTMFFMNQDKNVVQIVLYRTHKKLKIQLFDPLGGVVSAPNLLHSPENIPDLYDPVCMSNQSFEHPIHAQIHPNHGTVHPNHGGIHPDQIPPTHGSNHSSQRFGEPRRLSEPNHPENFSIPVSPGRGPGNYPASGPGNQSYDPATIPNQILETAVSIEDPPPDPPTAGEINRFRPVDRRLLTAVDLSTTVDIDSSWEDLATQAETLVLYQRNTGYLNTRVIGTTVHRVDSYFLHPYNATLLCSPVNPKSRLPLVKINCVHLIIPLRWVRFTLYYSILLQIKRSV